MDKKFPKKFILKKSYQYKYVAKMGCRYHTPHFLILVKRNSLNYPRLGITASRKIGNSVVRNRYKRIIKEVFRNYKNYLNSYDISIIVKKKIMNDRISFFFVYNEIKYKLNKLC